MVCTTTGFVLTKNKNISEIWQKIQTGLFNDMRKESGQDYLWKVWETGQFSYPSCRVEPVGGLFTVSFIFKGEQRDLSIHLDCDSDYSYVKKGKKIITSLGAWGESVHLTEIVLKALQPLGKTYMTDNGCSDEWREVL